jgi:hypothetical protein
MGRTDKVNKEKIACRVCGFAWVRKASAHGASWWSRKWQRHQFKGLRKTWDYTERTQIDLLAFFVAYLSFTPLPVCAW